jgi:energy-coupling factor transporter ATP-binding protein EcfA2
MIEWLSKNFPRGSNYLVCQTHSEQINQWIANHLILPFQHGRKHILWGKIAEQLPLVGKRLGWVPNKIGLSFLNETVALELADAFAVQENIFQPEARHCNQARDLLNQFKLAELSDQNPFSLSEGETKLLWFLTQWIKQPEYFVVGYLPTSLSNQRIEFIIDFLLDKANERTRHSVIILGYHSSQTEWYKSLRSRLDWSIVSRLPDDEEEQI